MNTTRNLIWAVMLIALGLYGVYRAEEVLSFQGIAGMVAAGCGVATLGMTLYARRLQRGTPPQRR